MHPGIGLGLREPRPQVYRPAGRASRLSSRNQYICTAKDPKSGDVPSSLVGPGESGVDIASGDGMGMERTSPSGVLTGGPGVIDPPVEQESVHRSGSWVRERTIITGRSRRKRREQEI